MVANHVLLIRNERKSERSDVSVMSRASTNEPEPAIIGEVVSFFFRWDVLLTNETDAPTTKKRCFPFVEKIGGLRHDEHLFI